MIIPFKRLPSFSYMAEEVEAFVNASKRSVLGYFVTAVMTCILLYDHLELTTLVIWFTAHIFYLLFRIMDYIDLKQQLHDRQVDISKRLRNTILLVSCGGVLWGATIWMSVLFIPHAQYTFYLLAITFGITAGSLVTLGPIFLSFIAFSGTLLLIQSTALIYAGGYGYLLTLLSIVFLIIMISSAQAMHKLFRKNNLLIVSLKKSREQLASLNDSLAEQVQEKTAKIENAYFHDALTGLENLFKCQSVIEEAEDNFLLLLDISHFSVINKSYGKRFADLTLIEVSKVLKVQLHGNMQLYKAESDRFMIYAQGSSKKSLENYCDAVFGYFDLHELLVNEEPVGVTFNVGLAVIDKKEDVIINTEFALEASKEQGTKQYTFFQASQELEKEKMRSIKMARYLIENNAIVPYFQEIQCVKDSSLKKFEVLARGIYEDEVILPVRFLEAAKHLGLLTSITRMMISKSFTVFEHNSADFSINITEFDLTDGYLVPYLKLKLKRHNIEAKRVTFEILETVSVDMQEAEMKSSLAELKALGFKIAVDDFGVESSNFLRLLELDLDFLKLDGIFIRDLDKSERGQKIVQAVINLSKTLGIKTVAEFVENETVCLLLQDLGIDYLQGYYIGKPQAQLPKDLR